MIVQFGESVNQDFQVQITLLRPKDEFQVQIELKAIFHNEFTIFQEEIQKQLNDKIKKIGKQGRDHGD